METKNKSRGIILGNWKKPLAKEISSRHEVWRTSTVKDNNEMRFGEIPWVKVLEHEIYFLSWNSFWGSVFFREG